MSLILRSKVPEYHDSFAHIFHFQFFGSFPIFGYSTWPDDIVVFFSLLDSLQILDTSKLDDPNGDGIALKCLFQLMQ